MTNPPTDLRDGLADRYLIERVVGMGGMATVYLAQDQKHARQVAVKVLRPEIAASIGSDRFLKEIEIAAQLNHPNILTLIDSGAVAQSLYYVMPYVEGESLRGMLIREKRLNPEATIPIVKEVADALAYAHRKGVVHRDIKPENILLSEGHAVVADFGIAKALMDAGTGNLTQSGFPLGTPGYMSPEQAAGLVDLDVRTDVFSLACVTYEMLVGEIPGMWVPDDVVRLRRFIDAQAAHREILDLLPGSLEQVLVVAMALRAELRYETPVEFVKQLETSLEGGEHFDEEQAARILAKAAELQENHPTIGETFSLGGLQQAAAEVGLTPERVEYAAIQLDLPDGQPTPGGILGTSPTLEVERYVAGEVTEAVRADLLEEIRVSLGEIGDVNDTLGTALSWSSPQHGSDRKAQILVSPKKGKTRILIVDKEGSPSSMIMAPISLVSMVLIGVTGAIIHEWFGLSDVTALIGALSVSGSVFSSAWWAARRAQRRTIEKRSKKLLGLMDRLLNRIRGSKKVHELNTSIGKEEVVTPTE